MLNGGINIYGKARENMSREIKFRVWDKSSKRMYGWESVKRDADFDDIVDRLS